MSIGYNFANFDNFYEPGNNGGNSGDVNTLDPVYKPTANPPLTIDSYLCVCNGNSDPGDYVEIFCCSTPSASAVVGRRMLSKSRV